MLTWGKTQIINYYKLCQQDDCISNTTECICCRKNDIYCLRHSFKYININGLVYCYYHSGKSICEDCGSSREQNMLMCDDSVTTLTGNSPLINCSNNPFN